MTLKKGTLLTLAASLLIIAACGKKPTSQPLNSQSVNSVTSVSSEEKNSSTTSNNDSTSKVSSTTSTTSTTSNTSKNSTTSTSKSEAQSYTVSVTNTDLVTIFVEAGESHKEGSTVRFAIQLANAEVVIDAISVKDASNADVTFTTNGNLYEFIMPSKNVSISVTAHVREPEIQKYSVTINRNDDVAIALVGTAVSFEKDETVSFTVSLKNPEKKELVSVKVKDSEGTEVTLSLADGVYSFTMPESDVSITVETANMKYGFVKENGDHATFSALGIVEKYEAGTEVTFSVSAHYGYKLNSFTLRGQTSGQPISYTPSGSQYVMRMPEENVIVSFVTEELYRITTEVADHCTVVYTDQSREFHAAGDEITVMVSSSGKYLVDQITVKQGAENITLTSLGDNSYKFTMPSGDVTITVTEKMDMNLENDPFNELTVFQGKFQYYDWDRYDMYSIEARFEFNGDKTLNFYVSYHFDYNDGEDEWEEWSNETTHFGPIKKYATMPSGMDTTFTLKYYENNVGYEYDNEEDEITFPYKRSTIHIKLQRNASKVIESIKVLDNLESQYATTANQVFKKK